jgi:hypothetical protein
MPTVDGERHEIRFLILVLGGVGQKFVENLNLKDGELELGEVQSFRPRFKFELFPDDPWSGDGASGKALEELVPYLDALILTDALEAGMHYSSTALERLASRLSPGKIRIHTAVFGGPALAQEWTSLTGVPLVHHSEPTEDQALPTLKALAKVLLRSNMRSTPPPPNVQ